MPTPVQRCPDCNKKMRYDPELSKKGRNITSFWCLDCAIILVESRFEVILKNKHDKLVGMPVTSARRYVFKGELP